jgi:copper homeostasis protein
MQTAQTPIGTYTAPPLLEIAVFTYHSAILAQAAGADRIELCENPAEGGTTPSYGYLKKAAENLQIPVFPIIRPRGGDFLYAAEEWDIVLKDIQLCKELGFTGIVTGSLNKEGWVQEEQLRRAVEIAYPMQVTFHRAFDRVADPYVALEQIIAAGCTRVLTSGLHPEVMAGIAILTQLVQQAKNRIVVMPGSGVRSSNLALLKEKTGAREFHASARIVQTSAMQTINTAMQEQLDTLSVNTDEIQQMKRILRA